MQAVEGSDDSSETCILRGYSPYVRTSVISGGLVPLITIATYTSHVANATESEEGYTMKNIVFPIVVLILGVAILVGACAAIDNDINQTAAEPHSGLVWHS